MKKLMPVIPVIFASLFLVYCSNRPNPVESDPVKKISFLDSLNLANSNERLYIITMDSASLELTKEFNAALKYKKIQDSVAEANTEVSCQINGRDFFLKMNKLNAMDASFNEKLKESDEKNLKAKDEYVALTEKISFDYQRMIQKACENYQTMLEKARQKYP